MRLDGRREDRISDALRVSGMNERVGRSPLIITNTRERRFGGKDEEFSFGTLMREAGESAQQAFGQTPLEPRSEVWAAGCHGSCVPQSALCRRDRSLTPGGFKDKGFCGCPQHGPAVRWVSHASLRAPCVL